MQLSINLKRLIRTDLGMALLIILIWKIILTSLGYILDTRLPIETSGLLTHMPEGLLGHTLRWDAGWYLEIIRSSFYQQTSSQGAVFAFYPLYPLLVGALSALSLGALDLPTASFIINTLASILIVVALIRITRLLGASTELARIASLIFIASPAAFFLHVFYSEAVFIALGAWAYLFALRRQWGYMCLLLVPLTAARLPAVLFLGLCALEYLRAHQWNFRQTLKLRSTLWFLVTPLGFLSYSAWCYYVTGDPLAMFHAYKAPDGWTYQVFNPNVLSTMFHSVVFSLEKLLAGEVTKLLIVNYLLPIASLTILTAGSLWSIFAKKGVGIPLGAFGLVAALMFTLNSNLVSVHRYILACIPLFVICSLFLTRHPHLKQIIYVLIPVMFALQLGLYTLFIAGYFAG